MKILISAFLVLCAIEVSAQNIGINATGDKPHPSAMLDIQATDKGILIPRVSLQSIADAITIHKPAPWLIVFNINNNVSGGDGAGLYFNGGSEDNPLWVKLVAQKVDPTANAWLTQGNTEIDTAVNYIGNADDRPLLFRIKGVKAGLLDTEASRNTFFGFSAGVMNTGTSNTFMGSGAGGFNTTGSSNVAVGAQALQGNSTGSFNIAIGDSALASFNNNVGNVAIGSKALSKATSAGQCNTAVGYEAMRGAASGAVTGTRNTAVGFRTLNVYSTGRSNVAVGADAMRSNTTGWANVALGDSAMGLNTIGSRNVAVGRYALSNNVSGTGNVAIGENALFNNGNRSGNVAVGDSSLFFSNTLNPNTAVGSKSLLNLQPSSLGFNTAIGRNAMYRLTTGNSNTGIGDSVGFSMTKAVDNILMGRNAGRSIVSGSRIIAIGNRALERYAYAPPFDVSFNANNIAIGHEAMFFTNATDTLSFNGRSNVGVGNLALRANTIGSRNTVMGDSVMTANVGGSLNSAFGYRAMEGNIGGSTNSAFGALTSVGSNFNNSGAFGFQATALDNNYIAIGNSAVTEIRAIVNLSIFSDNRFKLNVEDNVPGLAFIKGLRPVTYTYDLKALHKYLRPFDHETPAFEEGQESVRYSGFMAQEVEALSKSLGYEFSGVVAPRREGGTYGIRYAEFVVPLVKAVQEQQQIIEKQQETIQQQATVLEELLSRLERLEKNSNNTKK